MTRVPTSPAAPRRSSAATSAGRLRAGPRAAEHTVRRREPEAIAVRDKRPRFAAARRRAAARGPRAGQRSDSMNVPGHGWYARTWRSSSAAGRGVEPPVLAMQRPGQGRARVVLRQRVDRAAEPARHDAARSCAPRRRPRPRAPGASRHREAATPRRDDRPGVEPGVHPRSASRPSRRRRPGSWRGSATPRGDAAAATDGGSGAAPRHVEESGGTIWP